MKANIANLQNKVLKALAGKIDDFYLAGGTALSLYYFNHRQSLDLDFFTQDFAKDSAIRIIELLSASLRRKIGLIGEETRRNRAKIMVYNVHFSKRQNLKIDFVHDYLKLLKLPRSINGIKVLSLEDIFIRKICCICGTLPVKDSLGRTAMTGGRQEAKDYYDLYCLSAIFMRLSDFAYKFLNPLMREALIRWFRTYDRLEMKVGLLELKLKKKIDYVDIERHFAKEIDRIIEKEVAFI